MTFYKLFRDFEIEDTSNAAICAAKSPTAREVLVVAATEGSLGEAQDKAGSCCEPSLVVQQIVGENFIVSVLYKSSLNRFALCSTLILVGRALLFSFYTP